MNTILDKFGIYDLIAVLMSGITILTFTLLVLQIVYDIDISIKPSDTLQFLVISYFIGLFFQELGSLVFKRGKPRNSKLLNEALCSLSETEKYCLYKIFREKIKTQTTDIEDIYNYCKYYIIKNLNTTKMDKDLSISGMSRSLSLYFGLLMVFSFLTIFIKPTCLTIISPLIYGIISSLLYLRYLRFTKLRYTNIFRTFLYNFFE